MKLDDNAEWEIGDDITDNTGESSVSSNIKDYKLDEHNEKILRVGELRHNQLLQTAQVPLPKTQNDVNIVIACPLLPISWNAACNGRDRAQVMWMLQDWTRNAYRGTRIRISFKIVLLLAIQENE